MQAYFLCACCVAILILFLTSRRFGTWTVAKLNKKENKIVIEGPVCNGTKVIGWHTNEPSTPRFRRFHAEMSGFAFNSTILWDPKRWRRPTIEAIRQPGTVKEEYKVCIQLILSVFNMTNSVNLITIEFTLSLFLVANVTNYLKVYVICIKLSINLHCPLFVGGYNYSENNKATKCTSFVIYKQ